VLRAAETALRPMGRRPKLAYLVLRSLTLGTIRLYQLTLSRLFVALFGPVCRFDPSCSAYALACIEGHGVARGSLLSLRRLCRCHPFSRGGFDPPPAPSRIPRGSFDPSGSTAGPESECKTQDLPLSRRAPRQAHT
jgi:putative membrane protein insertion efficiency factor